MKFNKAPNIFINAPVHACNNTKPIALARLKITPQYKIVFLLTLKKLYINEKRNPKAKKHCETIYSTINLFPRACRF